MNIYWTAYAEFDTISTFDFLQPNKLELNFSKDPSKSFTICPAYQDQIRNTYELKFPNTYNILLDKNILMKWLILGLEMTNYFHTT